jgi:hypothetical protein
MTSATVRHARDTRRGEGYGLNTIGQMFFLPAYRSGP